MTETDARYRHASGEDGGCMACFEDGYSPESRVIPAKCQHPEPDPAEPGQCRWCSHSIERLA